MYLTTCCRGAHEGSGDDFQANEKLIKVINSSSQKDGIIEKFILNRCTLVFPKNQAKEKIFWQLLCFEVMFLWNLLSSCDSNVLECVISACRAISSRDDEPIFGLTNFIIATCFKYLTDIENAIIHFRKCIDECNENISNIKFLHIPAYANYELANLLLKFGNAESKIEAQKLLHNAQQFKNFDFESRLKLKLQSIKF